MGDPRQPPFTAPAASYDLLGDVTLGDQLGLGELSLDHHVQVAPGTWRAWFLDEDARDALVDAGQLAEDRAATQLVLVHAGRPDFDGVFPPLRFALQSPIEAARFTAADLALADLLATDDGFYDYLDGTHGVLNGGRGVHVMLMGDGEARVWLEDVAAPRLVVIELG